MNRSNIAKRAVKTNKARREFRELYGQKVMVVLSMLVKNKSASSIVNSTGCSVGSVAAIKANLTRGTYEPYVKVYKTKIGGTCNLKTLK